MKKILFVVGPALGHVGRALIVAKEISKMGAGEVHFAGVEPGYGRQIIQQEYPYTGVSYKSPGGKLFANRLEETIDRIGPHLVCFDMAPFPWLSLVRFPEIPSAYLSNYFLIAPIGMATQQDKWFIKHGGSCNVQREKRGLPPLSNSRELYEREAIMLADPPCIIPSEHVLSKNHYLVGPCVWEPEIDLPPELEEINSILYISLGSTGKRPLPKGLAEDLADALGIDVVVWAGKIPSSSSQIKTAVQKLFFTGKQNKSKPHFIGPRQLVFKWLPGDKVLHKASFAITQGGAGSTYQALRCGVPLGLWPTFGNHHILSRLLQDIGVGMQLGIAGNMVEMVRSQIEVLRSRSITISKSLSTIDGPKNAADILVRLSVGQLEPTTTQQVDEV